MNKYLVFQKVLFVSMVLFLFTASLSFFFRNGGFEEITSSYLTVTILLAVDVIGYIFAFCFYRSNKLVLIILANIFIIANLVLTVVDQVGLADWVFIACNVAILATYKQAED